ncbi:hypothetical protein ANN_28013 [Periplaneta americana]|uniref:Reverse transcriptase domain-containing protein n=1 Tax=Periplaneta americana TaxID=6978 RepID=A0ABQ8RUH8_PERAM|nr:hypothetical protein ANN_28013 [Periplaneta americana]
MKVIYKEKGDVGDMNAHKGIALECTAFKVFSKLFTKKLTELTDNTIPKEQFSFKQGQSTLQAVQCLLNDIFEVLQHQKGRMICTFVDFTKAFDLLDRGKMVQKLADNIGAKYYITTLIKDILSTNYVQVNDNLKTTKLINQTIGILQAHCSST